MYRREERQRFGTDRSQGCAVMAGSDSKDLAPSSQTRLCPARRVFYDEAFQKPEMSDAVSDGRSR